MNRNEPERVQPIEEHLRMISAPHLHGQRCLVRVDESVHDRHAMQAGEQLRGHVERVTSTDGGELSTVADQSEGGARLFGNSKQSERLVLTAHASLVDDDSFAAAQ